MIRELLYRSIVDHRAFSLNCTHLRNCLVKTHLEGQICDRKCIGSVDPHFPRQCAWKQVL